MQPDGESALLAPSSILMEKDSKKQKEDILGNRNFKLQLDTITNPDEYNKSRSPGGLVGIT